MDLHERQKRLEKDAKELGQEIEKQKTELENLLATSNPQMLREMQSLLSKAASGEMSVKEIEEWYKQYQPK